MREWDPSLGVWFQDDTPPHPLATAAYRNDGYYNQLTGLGTGQDRVQALRFGNTRCDILDAETCAGMVMFDALAARIVEAPVEESFRKGYELEIETDEEDEADAQLEKDFCKDAERLELDSRFAEAWTWGRGIGGALLYINANDGKPPSEPLDETSIKSIDSLIVFDRRYARVGDYYTDLSNPVEAANFGRPKTYWLASESVVAGTPIGAGAAVHESRCIRFGGSLTDRRTRFFLGSWDLSVLQRPWEKIRVFEQAFQSVGHAFTDFSQSVWGIDGLYNLITAGQGSKVGARIAELDRNRSSARSAIIDKEKESFTNIARNMSGIPEGLDRFCQYLAMSVPMPVTILMGRSPAGMNATGEADFQAWYDTVASKQDKDASPKLKRIYRLMSLAKEGPSGGVEKSFCTKWRPLKEMSDTERATVEKTTADKDVAYINAGVLTPEEVALARFGGREWSAETTIDIAAREEAQAKGLSFDPVPNDPEPDPIAPPAVSGVVPPPPVE